MYSLLIRFDACSFNNSYYPYQAVTIHYSITTMSTWSPTNVRYNSQKQICWMSAKKQPYLQSTMPAYSSLFYSALHAGRFLWAVHSVLPMGSVSLTKVCLWQWPAWQASKYLFSYFCIWRALGVLCSPAFILIVLCICKWCVGLTDEIHLVFL